MHRLFALLSIPLIGLLPLVPFFSAEPSSSQTELAEATSLSFDVTADITAAAECSGTNIATDPSFEGQFQSYVPPGGHPECPDGICTSVRTPPDWTPWWTQNKGDPLFFKMPEFTTETPESNWYGPARIRSGRQIQQHFTLFSTHEGGSCSKSTRPAGIRSAFRSTATLGAPKTIRFRSKTTPRARAHKGQGMPAPARPTEI